MLQKKVEQELERLQEQGVIEPVQFSDWAAPVVPVLKKDGSVRLCDDYKVMVNKAAKVDEYPLPRIDDLFASLSGRKEFSKLDLSHAYQQVCSDETSQQYVTISTHKGFLGIIAYPSVYPPRLLSSRGSWKARYKASQECVSTWMTSW